MMKCYSKSEHQTNSSGFGFLSHSIKEFCHDTIPKDIIKLLSLSPVSLPFTQDSPMKDISSRGRQIRVTQFL